MKKKFIWIIFAVISVTIIWIWQNREDKKAEEGVKSSSATESADDLEQKILAFVMDGRSPKGAKQWHLEGKSAEIKGDQIHLTDLTAVTYGDESTVNITSKRGIYYKEKGEVELMGNVVIISDDGSILTTERARWSQVTKEFFSDAIVHIKQEGMAAVGKGGKAHSENKTAMLKKKVIVMMKPLTKVKCDGPLKVRYNDNVAIFYDNVKVKDKDGSLFADKLTVNFDPETRKIAQVVGEGNARVKRGKSYTLSEKVVYTESTKSAKLIGKPRMIIDPVELSDLDETGEYEGKTVKEL